ncbi:MAG: ABC transporter permease [Collinsella sp.]|nr:ABC transporter permease [Collinsella sp.]
MLCKLAWGNVRRAGRDYLVYLLTLTLAVTMFYAFNTISIQIDYAGINSAEFASFLGDLIGGVTVFLALVMGFLMVYANNFIMKRRKKEFGLYLVLGMGRGQVARVMALETLIVSGAALLLGIVLGVGLSQLMIFFTAALFKTQIADFRFFFSGTALAMTVACLVATFLVTLVFNLRVVARAKIVDLMGAARANEAIKTRNPWIAAVVFAVGVGLVGTSYARLLSDGFPLEPGTTDAFFITTAMVIVGTILLFFGLSGFLLRVLTFARGLYWRGLNMFTLRQLSAKVNTVSFSMAVIAMVLFLAMTSVTGGMSIVNAMNQSIEQSTPADFTVSSMYAGNRVSDALTGEEDEQWAQVSAPYDLTRALTDENGTPLDLDEVAGDMVQVNTYAPALPGSDRPLLTFGDLLEATGLDMPSGMAGSNPVTMGLPFMRESEFNAYLAFRGMEPVSLGDDGYLIVSAMGDNVAHVYREMMSRGLPVTLRDRTLKPISSDLANQAVSFANGQATNGGTVVVPDDVVDAMGLPVDSSYLLLDYAPGVSAEQGDAFVGNIETGNWIAGEDGRYITFLTPGATRTYMYESMNNLNGMVSYLAIYIGFVLVVACAAILAIQQLSGVSDAGSSCRVLSELGTPRRQIMRSVLAQQAIFFVFPLGVALAHSLVALRVVIDLVELFGGVSIAGMAGYAVLIFMVAYGGYFLATYLMSKSIVRDAIRARHAA